MSIRVQYLRETWAFLRTFIGRAGEFTIDTTNNRFVVHDGATPGGFPTARADQVALAGRTPVTDANYAVLASDVTVAYTALTAARSVTLPAASGYPAGRVLTVLDETGACSATNTITVAAAGGDTVNGAASVTLATPYAVLGAMSNGAGKWVLVDQETTALQNLARLGLGTTADAANPFAAKLNKALWTALTTGEGGTGDLRYTLNKQDAGNTLSLLLQSGFSGRAEIGLTGDDDLRLKVSADGGTWREALRVEAATGAVSVAQAVTCGNPGLQTGAGLVVRESAHASGSRRATIALGSGWQINQDSLATGGRDFSLYSTALGRSALAVATSGQVTVSDGLNVGGGLTLNNGTGNTLQFASAGVAAPSMGSRSAGTKLVLYPNVSATEADFAVGIEIGAMWHSIPHSGTFYRWYAGSTQRMQLDGNGNLSAAGKITGTGFVSSAGDGATGLSVNVGNGYLSYQTFGASSFIWNYGTALFIGTSSAHSVAIATDNVARMTVAATGDVGMSGNLTVAGRLRPGSFTVATVPAGVAGDLVHVSNARKVGEAAGSGTGVLSYYSNGNWRRLSDDGPVAA